MSATTHYRWDDMPKEPLKADLHRRLITGDRMMLAHVYLKKGCLVPAALPRERAADLHPRGRPAVLDRRGRSPRSSCQAGEVLHIPPNVPHEAVALEDTLDVDVF